MAIIRDNRGSLLASNLSQYLAAAANTAGTPVDTNELVNILNQFLGQGEQISPDVTTISSGIYKKFGAIDKVTNRTEIVTSGIWSGDAGSLTDFYRSLVQSASVSGKYYIDVYDKDPASDVTAEVQFSIAYGHINGGGAPTLSQTDTSTLPTKAVYSQFRNILLDSNDEYFSVYSGSTPGAHNLEQFYAINVNRARYKERLDPGNIEISLQAGGSTYKFIDDSGETETVGSYGRVFNIVSGSLNIGTSSEGTIHTYTASNGQGYGLFYPDMGVVILNPVSLASTVGMALPVSSSSAGVYSDNSAILLAALYNGVDFQARRIENVSTSHYFVRANNREYNFSNNPTFITGSTGQFKQATFERDPKVYITSVGLYDDASELLAIAKVSKPIEKSFDKEVAIKVKLDF